jgi:hypothetical protein
MNLVDHWGRRSGIVKVIPPQEWCVPPSHPPPPPPSELELELVMRSGRV